MRCRLWAFVAPTLFCVGATAIVAPAALAEPEAGSAPPAATVAPAAAATAAPAAPSPAATAPAAAPAQAAAPPQGADPDYRPDTPPEFATPAPVTPPAAPAAQPAATAPDAAAPPAKPQLGALVRQQLAALPATASDAEKQDAAALSAFYTVRGDAPLWITDGALNAHAQALIAEIRKADDWGLDASVFVLPTATGALSEAQAAEAERQLSIAALLYARDARGGRITDPSKELSSYLDRKPQLLDPATVLAQLAASDAPDATLRGFHPQHPQFEKLRQKYLAMKKQAAEAAANIVIIPKGPALTPGQKNPNVVLLRKRLNVALPAGIAGAPADETLYDPALAEAVKAFQKEKGLRPDGIVGNISRTALNDIDLPSPEKIRANMELWRWMPTDLGPYYVWVNLPEFMVRVFKDGQLIHEERIVSGLVDKQTPVFSAEMELVTLHPRWNVPDSIKVKELYPSLARGGTYFEKQNLKLSQNGRPIDPYSVDWSSADIRKFDVQQPPGGSNVLGVVKFSFPNKHTVYMHDTPSKSLFDQASRPFSHGCMRVRNPVRLAEIILGNDKGWTAQQVDDIVNGPAVENPIPLDHKVPVHIGYFTEWIDDAGEEHRFKDVYGHEERVMLALEGRFNEIVVGPDHLAPVKYDQERYASGGNPLETFMNNLFGGF
jgi:murein L,D-transpeptidase YcbB/YkuD